MAIELEVIGKHAMLFDDDATLEFVNSKDALIEWNSLFIDRFDVRHLITAAPPSFRHLPTSFYLAGTSGVLPDDDSYLYPDLDIERFADLPNDTDNDDDNNDVRVGAEVELTNSGGYNCVPFSYGKSADSSDQKDSDMSLNVSSFHPSFPIPENLLQNLPPTEKVHQIIARTAKFVSEHGGQSEIVLRVKQGDNPTFGFLMPHHHLHPYFRYLVDHPEVLSTEDDSKSQGEKTNDTQNSGALSLLGSVYGTGEDEDLATVVDRDSKEPAESGTSSDMPKSNQSKQTLSAENGPQKDEAVSVHLQLSKVKVSALSKYNINSIKPGRGNSIKSNENNSSSIGCNMEKSKAPSLFLIQGETSPVDPPSEMKRLVDRAVEIILKNGKDFEKVLREQDKIRGKFPFLLSSNQYYPYYQRVLKKAQESRISGKTFCPEKDGLSWHEIDKNTAHRMNENDFSSIDESDDLDLDLEKKEKFKMVIPKPKKDSQDQPSKESQQQCGITVDATAAAAILQAATRGIRNPNLNIFSKKSFGSNIEGGPSSSLPQSLDLKENKNSSDRSHKTKLAAQVTGCEADCSEGERLRQQKIKAERLRRAKMFAAMIKSGVAPLGAEPLRASSLEPTGHGNPGSAVANVIEEVKGREGSYPPMEARMLTEMVTSDNEPKLSKRRHYRSRKHDDAEAEGNDRSGDDSEEDEGDKRRSVKRRKSRHHRDRTRRSKDRHKHRRRHSSSKSKESRHRKKYDSSSSLEDDDDRHHREKSDYSSEEERKERKHRHRHAKSSFGEESKDHKRRHRHDNSSSGEESKGHKHSHRHDRSTSEEESKHHKRGHKRLRRTNGHRERSVENHRSQDSHTEEVELEEGEIRSRSSEQSLSAIGEDASREASVDGSKSPHQEKRSSLPPTETTEVPDELRAKIRAMLLATM